MEQFFNDCRSIQELKSKYRELSKKYHPDNIKTGNLNLMKQINSQYETFYIRLEKERIIEKQKANKNYKSKSDEDFQNDIKQFFNIINSLMKYEKIEIEIIGVWVWVSGKTKPIKGLLKELGFLWHSKKKIWYYADPGDKRKSRYHSKEYDMDEIRAKYGSKKFNTESKKNRNFKAING